MLRRRAPNELDWDNLAEEIEFIGGSQRSETWPRLKVLHLLKWQYQPELLCGGWRGSIREAGDQIDDVLDENPTLRSYPVECLPKAYGRARTSALEETGLLRLPEACPWSIDEILSDDFLP